MGHQDRVLDLEVHAQRAPKRLGACDRRVHQVGHQLAVRKHIRRRTKTRRLHPLLSRRTHAADLVAIERTVRNRGVGVLGRRGFPCLGEVRRGRGRPPDLVLRRRQRCRDRRPGQAHTSVARFDLHPRRHTRLQGRRRLEFKRPRRISIRRTAIRHIGVGAILRAIAAGPDEDQRPVSIVQRPVLGNGTGIAQPLAFAVTLRGDGSQKADFQPQRCWKCLETAPAHEDSRFLGVNSTVTKASGASGLLRSQIFAVIGRFSPSLMSSKTPICVTRIGFATSKFIPSVPPKGWFPSVPAGTA
jgi:hypothetical protein